MNQSEVEQWIAQNGGQGRVQYSRSSQRVTNPAGSAVLPDGTDNPAYDPMAPKVIDVNEEKWTAVDEKGQPTGAVLHVRRRDDGNFDIVQQANPNPTKPQAGTRTPTEQAADAKAQQDQKEREKNAALPKDQDPRYETDAERDARAKATIATQRQQGIDDETRKRQADTDARAAAAANKPGVTQVDGGDGKKYTRVVAIDAQGNVKITNFGPDGQQVATIPGETPKPTIAPGKGPNGEDMQAVPDPDHPGQVKYVPIPGAKGPSTSKLPPGVTAPNLDGSVPVSQEMARFINELSAAKNAGTITDAQATEILKPWHDLASTALTEQTQQLNQGNQLRNDRLTLRGQDQTAAGNRATASQGMLDTAITASENSVKGADPKNFKPTLIPYLALQATFANAMGANRPVADVEVPALARRVGAAPTTAPAAPATAPVVSGPTPPNALGLGAIGNTPAPGSPAAQSAAATAEAQRQQQAAASASAQPVVAAPAVSTSPAIAPAGAPSRVVDSQPGAPMMPPAPPAGVPALPTTPADDPLINVRHKTTGAVSQMTLSAFNALPDRGDYEVFDPNSSGMATPGPATPAVGPQPTDQPNGLPPGQSVLPPDNGYGPAPSMLPSNEVTKAPSGNSALADRLDTTGPQTIQERAQQLIDSGMDPQAVYAAMNNHLARHGIGGPGVAA